MKDSPEAPRGYRSPLRAAQAARTRASILDAAGALFMEKGWAGTTIAAIAGKAGVSNETIYAAFGNKAAILQQLIADAVRGQAKEVPLLEQEVPAAIAAASEQHRQLALFARDITGILCRVAPLMAVLRSAAQTEPELAGLYRRMHAGRKKNLAFLVEAICANGPLGGTMTADAALALVWRLASPDLFLLMRDVEGVDSDGYAAWLEETLRKLLLPDRAGP